jgi:hypothetical protein
MKSYKYSIEDFILKRISLISNECFELKKIKSQTSNFLFVNTELPCVIYIHKESPVISNFNFKDCRNIYNLSAMDNYAFIFKENLILGSLNNSQSQSVITKNFKKQIYNLTYLEKINSIAFMTEDFETDCSEENKNDNINNNFNCNDNGKRKLFNKL